MTGIEEDGVLASAAQAQLSARGTQRAEVRQGALSAAGKDVYDVILIEGGVEEVGTDLLAQLAEGGRIAAVFMQGALGTVKMGTKVNGRVSWRFAFNASAPVLPSFAARRGFTL